MNQVRSRCSDRLSKRWKTVPVTVDANLFLFSREHSPDVHVTSSQPLHQAIADQEKTQTYENSCEGSIILVSHFALDDWIPLTQAALPGFESVTSGLRATSKILAAEIGSSILHESVVEPPDLKVESDGSESAGQRVALCSKSASSGHPDFSRAPAT